MSWLSQGRFTASLFSNFSKLHRKIFMWQLECNGTNVPICKAALRGQHVESPSSEIQRKAQSWVFCQQRSFQRSTAKLEFWRIHQEKTKLLYTIMMTDNNTRTSKASRSCLSLNSSRSRLIIIFMVASENKNFSCIHSGAAWWSTAKI